MKFEQLETRRMMASDWQSMPVYAQPLDVASASTVDTAAYDLVGSAQQRKDFGLTGTGYSVAIIDTGLDYKNPAFAGRYLGGWDFVNNDSDPMDDNGHGTHVAGIIGSADPTYTGIAPGVGLIALKALDKTGTGTFGNINLALEWVADHQAQYHIVAVNMSLGSGDYLTNPFTFLDDELLRLKAEGVFVAAASGNSYFAGDAGGTTAKDLTVLSGGQPGLAFPAVDPLVVSVGAVWAGSYGANSWVNGASDFTTAADQIASFTQRDANLELLAPGVYVTSTFLDNSFAALAGTSMATPFATGAAVLVKEALDARGEPSDQASVLKILQQTGKTITDTDQGQDNVTHTGLSFSRINVDSAVSDVKPLSDTESFVSRLYESLLNRQPEPAGLAYWGHLLNGGAPRSMVVLAVWNSYEHLADVVQSDYESILQRHAGVDEIAYWVHLMQVGIDNAQIQQLFYESEEYFKRHQP